MEIGPFIKTHEDVPAEAPMRFTPEPPVEPSYKPVPVPVPEPTRPTPETQPAGVP